MAPDPIWPASHKLIAILISIGPKCKSGLLIPVCLSATVCNRHFQDLADETLADEDTIPILANDANWAIPSNITRQVAPPSDQILNLCRWRHLVETNKVTPVIKISMLWVRCASGNDFLEPLLHGILIFRQMVWQKCEYISYKL